MKNKKHLPQWWTAGIGLLVIIGILACITINIRNASNPASTENIDVKQAYKKMETAQLPFIQNIGQTNAKVAYFSQMLNGSFFVENDGTLTYAFLTQNKDGSVENQYQPMMPPHGRPVNKEFNVYAIKELFETTKKLAPLGEEPTDVTVNYFLGNDKSQWKQGVKNCNSINLGEVFDGIGVRVRAHGNNVEKIFTVNPKADPANIKIKLEGADEITINEGGELEIKTAEGMISFTKPVAFQNINGVKKDVVVSYKTLTKNSYGFEVGEYDRDVELVIDPLLSATYLGGTGWEGEKEVLGGNTNMIIANGSLYISAYTYSADFPTIAGSYQTAMSGTSDAFISKFSLDLGTLEASTYLGGTSSESEVTLTADTVGNIFVIGNTSSTDFPGTAGHFQAVKGTNADAFIAKLDSGLTTLLHSTYLGGNNYDWGNAIMIGANGNVYVAVDSTTGYPTGNVNAPAGFDTTRTGSYNIAISQLDSNLSPAFYNMTFIGAGNYYGALAQDSSGDIFLTGGCAGAAPTAATDGPLTDPPGGDTANSFPMVRANTGIPSFQETAGGSCDTFVARFSSDLTTLKASTLFGGPNWENDYTDTIAVRGSGANEEVFIIGDSLNTISTANGGLKQALENNANTIDNNASPTSKIATFGPLSDGSGAANGDDVYVAKFNANLTAASVAILGGTDTDNIPFMALTSNGEVYLTADTYSTDFPTTTGAFNGDSGDNNVDIIGAKLSNDLGTLIGSSYITDSGYDNYPGTISVLESGGVEYAYINAETESTAVPGAANGYQPTYVGGGDLFISRFNCAFARVCPPTNLIATPGNTEVALTWDAPVGNVDPISSYIIHYSTDNFVTTDFTVTDVTLTSHTVTGLTNDVPYNFYVVALAGDPIIEQSPPSNTANATPTAPVDTDGDGVFDPADNCPTVPNPGQENTDGNVQVNLTNNPNSDYGAFVSPNGNQIAFVSNRDGNGEIYIMNANGTNQTRLTTNANEEYDPVFSPDGTKIAFVSDRDGNNELYLMNTDGTNQTRLTTNADDDYDPVFSPDSSKIAYTSSLGLNKEVFIMNADGTGQLNLSNSANWDDSPAFSPDGTKVAYYRYGDIYSVNTDGTGSTQLVSTPGATNYDPQYSPDGTRIVFTSFRDAGGVPEIYIMNANGTNQTRLTNNASNDWYPVFSPDGTQIAFFSMRNGGNEIFIMNSDGTGQTQLTTGANHYQYWYENDDNAPVFSPDGNQIIFGGSAAGNLEIYTFRFPDTIGDACDCQTDTFCTAVLYCTNNATPDADCPADTDGDGVVDPADNCPTVANPGQENTDALNLINLTNNPSNNSTARFSPDGTKIAFLSDRDGNSEIYIMNTDGSAQTNLTNNPAGDYNPEFSPDGTKIAFYSDRDGASEIYIMNTDGSAQTNLTNNPAADYNPHFSPDGTKITFESGGANGEIYIMNTDGSAQTNLTNNIAEEYNPHFSPDGTKITFYSFRDGNGEIYIMNTDGSAQTNLTNSAGDDVVPIFSPDGTKIAFYSSRDGNSEIYIMNVDGSAQTNLTNSANDDQVPIFSPDGTKITFESWGANGEVYIMNVDGSAQTNLTNSTNDDYDPSFAPNSSTIAFVGWDGTNDQIYTVNSNGDNLGNACDCQTDGLCTANAYCTDNATPDTDCVDCPGLAADQTCAVTRITGGDLSFTDIPDNTAFTNAQNNTNLPSYNNAAGTDTQDILSVTDLRDDPLAGFEVQLSASPFATSDNLLTIPLQYLYVASSLPRTAGATEDETEGIEYAADCFGPTNNITSSVNVPEPMGAGDLGILSTFTTSGSVLGTDNVTVPVVLMSSPASQRRCTISEAISYAINLPAFITALGTNIPPGTYSVTFTYTLIAL